LTFVGDFETAGTDEVKMVDFDNLF
jgi:hypothetical protein